MNGFARTDAGFNRPAFKKESVTNNQTRLNPIVPKNGLQQARHYSPQKVRTEGSAAIGGSLRLDK